MKLGWIDFSKEERDKVIATLKLLETPTALDELGIGVIRDAYADILFPGISTLQTRAKYFVLVPYIFAKAEKQNFSRSRDAALWINDFEDKLVKVIVNNSPPKSKGIIGSDALLQKKTVKMKPTSIYWSGLRTFEIVRNDKISFSQACDILIGKSKRIKDNPILKSEGEAFDDPDANNGGSTLFSPIAPDYKLENDTEIGLTKNEAKFLFEKITTALKTKDTLLAFLIKNKLNYDGFDDINVRTLPEKIKQDYLLAKNFADFIIGAHMMYNIIFSDSKDDEINISFETWKSNFDFSGFDISSILKRSGCNYSTCKFCMDFLMYIKAEDLNSAKELIIKREKEIKGDRSKLKKPAEYLYKRAHNYKLDYRYGTAKDIINDILSGLEGING